MMELEKFSELKLDIDHKDKAQAVDRIKWVLEKLPEIEVERFRVKETENGYHLYIFLSEPILTMYRAFLQAILGSDWKRETLNFKRFLDGEEDYNILFETKYEGNKKVSEEVPAPEFEEELNGLITER